MGGWLNLSIYLFFLLLLSLQSPAASVCLSVCRYIGNEFQSLSRYMYV